MTQIDQLKKQLEGVRDTLHRYDTEGYTTACVSRAMSQILTIISSLGSGEGITFDRAEPTDSDYLEPNVKDDQAAAKSRDELVKRLVVLLGDLKFQSCCKDNMEFKAVVTTWQLNDINKALAELKAQGCRE